MFAILGLIVSAIGAFWYWQIMQVAVALAARGGGAALNRPAWVALGLIVLGIVLFLVCIVLNLVIKDPDD